MRGLINLFLLGIIALVGCSTSENQIRLQPPPEEFRSPPDETRYSGPVQYPAETMEQDMFQKKNRTNTNLPGPTGGPGMPGRMGGVGGY